MEPDEIDDHGQGWVYLSHAVSDRPIRFPVEAAPALYEQGWRKPIKAQAAVLKRRLARQ